MLNAKEAIIIIVSTLILSFSISLLEINNFFVISLMIFLIIMVNIFVKKITSLYFDSEVEIKLWEMERYGLKPRQYFKKPIPIGLILPIVSKILLFSLKNFVWMASLVFDVKPKVYRAAKRHGLYLFSEMTEDHIGYIAAAGILANLFFSVIGYLLGFQTFARLSIYYSFFNMIPISNLDGNKIFFGNLVLWFFLATIVLLGLIFAIFVI